MGPQTVLLCGASAAEKRLAQSLNCFGCVQVSQKNRLSRMGSGSPVFLLYEYDTLPNAEIPDGILLLGSRLLKTRARLPTGAVPVFASDNESAARLLIPQQRAGISCGCAPQDTLSLASLSDTQAVISLQRSLRTLTGAVIEPRDLTVRLGRPYELFELMAVCAVLMLSGLAPDGRITLSEAKEQLFS